MAGHRPSASRAPAPASAPATDVPDPPAPLRSHPLPLSSAGKPNHLQALSTIRHVRAFCLQKAKLRPWTPRPGYTSPDTPLEILPQLNKSPQTSPSRFLATVPYCGSPAPPTSFFQSPHKPEPLIQLSREEVME